MNDVDVARLSPIGRAKHDVISRGESDLRRHVSVESSRIDVMPQLPQNLPVLFLHGCN